MAQQPLRGGPPREPLTRDLARDGALSSELCATTTTATRPNPFDDSDTTSRKRRRTSQSGSPSWSVDASQEMATPLAPTAPADDGEDGGAAAVAEAAAAVAAVMAANANAHVNADTNMSANASEPVAAETTETTEMAGTAETAEPAKAAEAADSLPPLRPDSSASEMKIDTPAATAASTSATTTADATANTTAITTDAAAITSPDETMAKTSTHETSTQETAKTPLGQIDSADDAPVPPPPSSNRVTINLRAVAPLPGSEDAGFPAVITNTVGNMADNPVGNTTGAADAAAATDGAPAASVQDQQQHHGEVPEVNMTPAPGLIAGTPNSMSSKDSATEVGAPPAMGQDGVAVANDDHGSMMDILLDSGHNAGVDDFDDALIDPSADVPYMDQDSRELPADCLGRLSTYIASQVILDEGVFDALAAWLGRCVSYLTRAGHHQAAASCLHNKPVWHALAELVWAALHRKTSLAKLELTSRPRQNFYGAFARLVACFVSIDARSVVLASLPGRDDDAATSLELTSPSMMVCLNICLRSEHSRLCDLEAWALREDMIEVVPQFQPGFGSGAGSGAGIGSLELLAQFVQAQLMLLPKLPRLAENMGALLTTATLLINITCRELLAVAGVCVGSASSAAEAGASVMADKYPAQEQRLVLGLRLFDAVAAALPAILDKSAAHMSTDNVVTLIRSLTEIYVHGLHSQDPAAVQRLVEHQALHPDMPPKLGREALPWRWRFATLGRLIKTSQMQLRVLAVSTMCTDLINIWKRYGEPAQPAPPPGAASYMRYHGMHLLESGLVDYILGPTCHPEIISEAGNILGFLVVTRLYGDGQTDLVWHSITSSQDPRVSEALTRMVCSIMNLYSYETIEYLCEKMQTLRADAFSPSIRTLCESIFSHLAAKSPPPSERSERPDRSPLQRHQHPHQHQHQSQRHSHASLGSPPTSPTSPTTGSTAAVLPRAAAAGVGVGVGVAPAPFYICLRLLREATAFSAHSQVARQDVHDFAKAKLRDMAAHLDDMDVRRHVIGTCIDHILSRSRTTLGSLWGLFIFTRPMLHHLAEEYDLTRLVVDELEHGAALGRAEGYPLILSHPSAEPRRDLIYNLMVLKPETVTTDLGCRLWDMLVGPKASCPDDRRAGWSILNSACRKLGGCFAHPYLRMCFSDYFPNLPASCFCEGALEFLKEGIRAKMQEFSRDAPPSLDDAAFVADSGIEQLWRLILTTDDQGLADRAVPWIISTVYIDSKCIMNYPHHRARQVHLNLVNRCLRQLSEAAQALRASSSCTLSAAEGRDDPAAPAAEQHDQQHDQHKPPRKRTGVEGGDDDDGTDTDTTMDDDSKTCVRQQERTFTRSLVLLRHFLNNHRAKAHFAAPDLRSFMHQSQPPSTAMQGESAELKYQSFDGDTQTEVIPLHIGRRNTAASLLASIKEVTGFDNYRIYYRGQPFAPTETEICRSLEELQVHDGLILVKREDCGPPLSVRIRPGSSPLEIEILTHFEELWEYLTMKQALAQEIYNFLIRLPAHDHVLARFESDSTQHQDVFPPGQPLRTLYAFYALGEYLGSIRGPRADVQQSLTAPATEQQLQDRVSTQHSALKRVLRLVVAAIEDEQAIISLCRCPAFMCLIYLNLLTQYKELSKELRSYNLPAQADTPKSPALGRILAIIETASGLNVPDRTVHLIRTAVLVILDLCFADAHFWADFKASPAIPVLFQELLLREPLPDARKAIAQDLYDRTNPVRQFDRADQVPAEARTAETGDGDGGGDADGSRPPATGAEFLSVLWAILMRLIPTAVVQFPAHCEQVLDLTHEAAIQLCDVDPTSSVIPDLARLCCGLLLQHTTTEELSQAVKVDLVASGLSRIIDLAFHVMDLSRDNGLPADLATMLFTRHLFPASRRSIDDSVPHSVITRVTRERLYDIVVNLVRHDDAQSAKLIQLLADLVPYDPDDADGEPYIYELPYGFDREKAVRSQCGYVGLRNLSNTCYLNSLLTQLFMNTGFRQFLIGAAIHDADDSQKLLFQTQKLFGHMQETYRRSVEPFSLVGSIKTYDDTVIDINNQMDVDEFYNLLFDRWESQLGSAEEKRTLRSYYGGQLVQQVKSKECEHVSERLETFQAIQCDIKGKNTLEDSLQAYVDGEIMEGDNKYKCSTCDRHVDAVKRTCLKDMPDNLIFHLKRFDFNLRTLQRAKINDYFSFPTRVDMRPYTIGYLSQPQSGDPAGAGCGQMHDDQGPDVFELVGILVHSGTAESGHYYSYVRERPSGANAETWIEFNDDSVTPWDPVNMESSTFGGTDCRSQFDGGMVYEKTYSAYMLFYERSSALRARRDRLAAAARPMPPKAELPRDILDHVRSDNTTLLRRHCLYDPSHVRFVQRVLENLGRLKHNLSGTGIGSSSAGIGSSAVITSNTGISSSAGISGSTGGATATGSGPAGSATKEEEHEEAEEVPRETQAEDDNDHLTEDMAVAVALGHLDQVVTRRKDTPDLFPFVDMIRAALGSCGRCAYACYRYFLCHSAVLRVLVQRHPDSVVRIRSGELFITALSTIKARMPRAYHYPDMDDDGIRMMLMARDNLIGQPVLRGAARILAGFWPGFHSTLRSWNEVFSVALAFARIGDPETVMLLSDDWLYNLTRIIWADPSVEMPAPYQRMLTNVLRRQARSPPQYEAIIGLIRHLMAVLDDSFEEETSEPIGRLRSYLVGRRRLMPASRLQLPWTPNEINLLHWETDHPRDPRDSQPGSLFVEKLIGIGQAPEDTAEILSRLVAMGPRIDSKVYWTIIGALDFQANPSLDVTTWVKAALAYCLRTESVGMIQGLMIHLSIQTKHAQAYEAKPFFEFHQTTFEMAAVLPDGKTADVTSPVFRTALQCVAHWAPAFLLSMNSYVRDGTVDFIQKAVLPKLSALSSPTVSSAPSSSSSSSTSTSPLSQWGLMTSITLESGLPLDSDDGIGAGNTDPDTDADADADADVDAVVDADATVNGDADATVNGDADAIANANGDADAIAIPDVEAGADAIADTDAAIEANAANEANAAIEAERNSIASLIMRELGVQSLTLLSQKYGVKRPPRDIMNAVNMVVGLCGPYYTEGETADDIDRRFTTLLETVLNPLMSDMSDDLEEEGSDWDNSAAGSSEALDDMLSIQAVNDVDMEINC